MRRFCICLALGTTVALCPTRSVGGPDDPTVEEIIRLAPSVSSADKRNRRIKVVSSMSAPRISQLLFLAAYQAPDRFFLCIADGRDGTPLAYLCDNQLVMYNAVDGDVLYFMKASFCYVLRLEDSDFRHRCNLFRFDGPCSIIVDVKSLYARAHKRDELGHAKPGAFRLTRTWEDGLFLIALVDPSRRSPFMRIEYSDIEIDAPIYVVRELYIDDEVRGPWPVFPPFSRFAAKLTLKNFNSNELPADHDVLRFMQKCLFARQAIGSKELRQLYELEFGAKVDWRKAEGNDLKVSRAIREVLGTPIKVE